MEYLDIAFKNKRHSDLQLYQQSTSGAITRYQQPPELENDEKLTFRRYFDLYLEAGTKILLSIPPNEPYELALVTRTIGVSTEDAHHIRALLHQRISPTIEIASYTIYPAAPPPNLFPSIDNSYLTYIDSRISKDFPFEIQVKVEEFYKDLRYGRTVPHSEKLSLSETLNYFPRLKLENSKHRSNILYSFTQENLAKAPFLPTDRFLTLYETLGESNRKNDLVMMTFKASGACSALDEYVEKDEKIVKLFGIPNIRPAKIARGLVALKYDVSSFEDTYPPQSKILLYIPLTCSIQVMEIKRFFISVTPYQMYQAHQDRKHSISIAQYPHWQMLLTGHVPLLWQLYLAVKTNPCFE